MTRGERIIGGCGYNQINCALKLVGANTSDEGLQGKIADNAVQNHCNRHCDPDFPCFGYYNQSKGYRNPKPSAVAEKGYGFHYSVHKRGGKVFSYKV